MKSHVLDSRLWFLTFSSVPLFFLESEEEVGWWEEIEIYQLLPCAP